MIRRPDPGPAGSPFSPVLESHADRLPSVLRDHYLLAADRPHRVVLEGTMDHVWHRPGWLWPLLWLSTRWDLLFPETGTAIPATMTVTGCRAENGHAYQTWNRSFVFPPVRHFNAIMLYDPVEGCVVERLGRGQFLELTWMIRFVEPASIEIETGECRVGRGRWRVRVPRILRPAVRAVETAVGESSDAIRIELAMTHPWLGRIFGYEGTFRLRRERIDG